jgi:hypothetical protein
MGLLAFYPTVDDYLLPLSWRFTVSTFMSLMTSVFCLVSTRYLTLVFHTAAFVPGVSRHGWKRSISRETVLHHEMMCIADSMQHEYTVLP